MSMLLSLEPAPDLENLPWACVRGVGLPTTSFGKPVEWLPGYVPQPVFIGRCLLPQHGEWLIFGLRHDFEQRTLPPPEKGFFIRFVVVEATADGPVAHVLAQQRSTTFQSGEESRDSVFPSDLKKKELAGLCLAEPPRWKAGDAQWPLLQGSPMSFAAQFPLPENEVTRRWLTFNETVFLFWREHEGRSVFKITTQETRFQSAEDHYRVEARRMKKS
jgi:hypothetical protein